MNVFISWSGDRSQRLAKALAMLLPDILQDVKPWMSDDDIRAGSRWGNEVNQHLQEGNFGVLCLTPENIGAPWLLFEAGSLAKSIANAKVVPYRLGLGAADVPYPLAQFQGVDADESGTRKLVSALNSALSSSITDERLARVFQRW